MLGHAAGQFLTASGAQTAEDNKKLTIPFLIAMNRVTFWLFQIFKISEILFFDGVILFLFDTYIPCPIFWRFYGLILELDQL